MTSSPLREEEEKAKKNSSHSSVIVHLKLLLNQSLERINRQRLGRLEELRLGDEMKEGGLEMSTKKTAEEGAQMKKQHSDPRWQRAETLLGGRGKQKAEQLAPSALVTLGPEKERVWRIQTNQPTLFTVEHGSICPGPLLK
ncbi:hypothetical protein WMY93_028746 [Mugilogobius chulae]|uniref:Uncharacterized protein n=1 Tax=Mugilogobius chulae TaxID=88201 RepID=A0AAW0MZL5_9GOBI